LNWKSVITRQVISGKFSQNSSIQPSIEKNFERKLSGVLSHQVVKLHFLLCILSAFAVFYFPQSFSFSKSTSDFQKLNINFASCF